MKKKILIMGAGAIGRGYLPWALDMAAYDFVFVDSSQRLVNLLNNRRSYSTYRVKNGKYEHKRVNISAAYITSNFNAKEHADAAACFFSVGPKNILEAASKYAGTKIPLILCENDPDAVETTKQCVGHSDVYFAVPDVITSNTAPDHLLAEDPLAITTEDGVLFVQQGLEPLRGNLKYISSSELLINQWIPKLFLHNTPHCIAAYLGALMGRRYIHEVMVHPVANAIVEGAMKEMLQSLKLKWDIPHDFLDGYSEKELQRFRCELLCDPVARVAREPLRKLELKGRLIGAAQICLTLGVSPHNLLKGIVSAMMFDNEDDEDHQIALMFKAMDIEQFNRYVIGLRSGEPLDLMLREKNQAISEELQVLAKLA
jgi:mannitol-1-phosphate 5-dehydrogenase